MHMTNDEGWHPWRLGANYAVLNARNDRWGLEPRETRNSSPKVAVSHAKTTDEGWDP